MESSGAACQTIMRIEVRLTTSVERPASADARPRRADLCPGLLHPLVTKRHCSEQTLSHTAGVKFLAVRRDLFAVEHAVVTDDTCDPQAIVSKNACSALCLRTTVLFECPPRRNGLLIPKERE